MTSARALLFDDFENGVLDFTVLPGNGTISEAGGLLTAALSAGQNGDWRAGKLAQFPFSAQDRDVRLNFETELTALSGTGNVQAWCGLYQDDANNVWLYLQGTSLYAYRIIGGTWTPILAWPSNPVTLPIKLGFRWNPRTREVVWRANAGAGWVEFVTQTLSSFAPGSFFFYLRNFSGTPAGSVSYSYLTAEAEVSDLAVVGDKVSAQSLEDALLLQMSGQSNLTGILQPTAGVLDAATRLDVGGPVYHTSGVSAGLRLPEGSPLRSPDLDEPERAAGGAFQDAGSVELRDPPPGWRTAIDEDGRVQPKGGPYDATSWQQGASECQFNSYAPTLDAEGHQHLTDFWVFRGFVYDATKDAWHFPTAGGFSGYAQNGKKYTNGVEDAGPVWAPWASEAASQDRSARDDFPDLTFLAVDRRELVVYDLDLYHAGGIIKVWMRFKLGLDASNFYLLGRGDSSVQDVFMLNGVLYVATKTNSWESGGLIAVDFKGSGQNFAQLIRSDGHWRGVAGKTVVHRNTAGLYVNTGFSPSLRLNSEDNYHVRASVDPADPRRAWAVVTGEDDLAVVKLYDNAGVTATLQNPDADVSNVGDVHSAALGRDGELWFAQRNRVVRNGLDYRGGVMVDPGIANHGDVRGRVAAVSLPENVTSLAIGANHVYAGTARGVYRVHRTTLAYDLCYTIAGGGGGGRLGLPPAGEVIPGTTPAVTRLQVLRALRTDYLVGTAWPVGGAWCVRCHDDVVIDATVWPVLQEPGAFFARSYMVA